MPDIPVRLKRRLTTWLAVALAIGGFTTTQVATSPPQRAPAVKYLRDNPEALDDTSRHEGLTPEIVADIRQSIATYWPSVAMKVDGDVGTVSPGKYADVIAVRGDVLRYVALLQRVDIVVKRGTRYK